MEPAEKNNIESDKRLTEVKDEDKIEPKIMEDKSEENILSNEDQELEEVMVWSHVFDNRLTNREIVNLHNYLKLDEVNINDPNENFGRVLKKLTSYTFECFHQTHFRVVTSGRQFALDAVEDPDFMEEDAEYQYHNFTVVKLDGEVDRITLNTNSTTHMRNWINRDYWVSIFLDGGDYTGFSIVVIDLETFTVLKRIKNQKFVSQIEKVLAYEDGRLTYQLEEIQETCKQSIRIIDLDSQAILLDQKIKPGSSPYFFKNKVYWLETKGKGKQRETFLMIFKLSNGELNKVVLNTEGLQTDIDQSRIFYFDGHLVSSH